MSAVVRSFFKRKTSKSKLLIVEKNSSRPDLVYLIAVLLLAALGSVAVFSAGHAYAAFRYGDGLYFAKKQIIWVSLGFAVLIVTSKIPVAVFKLLTPYLYAITLGLLVMVLAMGFVGNGAQRWISIGPLTLQPSEICKLVLVLMLAKYFSDFQDKISDRKNNKSVIIYGTIIPFAIILIPIILVMLQKHLSCIIILGTIGILVIFISGVNPKYLYALLALGIAAVSALALFTDYTKDRITVWRNPEAYQLTGGWQTLQGLMAIGSGGLFGVGIGKSVLKHCYVSEPANDMIFAILCEECGFVGAVLTLLLFAFVCARGFIIGMRSSDTYSRIAAYGISIKTAVQVLLNVGVVTNTIPNTGISLPFFSYGGSSLIMMFLEVGIMLSISKNAKIRK